MVLVTLATTVALQTGTADLLKKSYPTDYSATAFVEDTSTIPPTFRTNQQDEGAIERHRY